MNNYFKGIASLLDIYATQKIELDIKHPSWDDFSALKSDWEKISEDLKISILKYTSDLDTINKTLSELVLKLKNMPIHNAQLVDSFHQNILSQKELLEKMNQKLGNEQPNVSEKESE